MREYAKKLMDTAMLAGQIMLECNAESYRVEETMNYILSTSHFATCEAFANATGIFATLDDDCIDCITEIRRVPNRDTNLNRIYKVNSISRQLVSGEIDINTAYEKFQNLKESDYPSWLKNIGLIIMCGCYAALYGATLLEMFVAGLAAIILPFVYKLDAKLGLGMFITNLISIIPMVVIICYLQETVFPTIHIGIPIIGAIMPAVPGTAITNAIRDTLRGDYNSGTARAVEAAVTALSISIAVAIGLLIGGGVNPL